MNIIILGAPGSGKGTQSKLLSDQFGFKHLSTGDMLRERCRINDELGSYIKDKIDNGHFVNDETILKLIEEEFNKTTKFGYLFDGYPRNLTQAEGFDELLIKIGREIDLVINLEIDDKLILERITGRRVCKCGESYHLTNNPPAKQGICNKCGKQLYQRADDNKEGVRVRLITYYKQTHDLISYYNKRNILVNINALQAIEDVNQDIVKYLEVQK